MWQSLENVAPDDVQYVLDFGLCCRDEQDKLVIANPIYQEIVPKNLAFVSIASLPSITPIWLNAEGGLDVDQLLESFLAFWRQHGHPMIATGPITRLRRILC